MKHIQPMSTRPRQRGLSLVELMVAIALGLLILLGIVSVFAGSRANYRQQESSSAVQEAGRIALELLNRDIRMAGYPGCGNVGFVSHLTPAFSNNVAVTGVSSGSAVLPDSITVVRASANVTEVPVGAQAELITVPVANAVTLGALVAGNQLLVTDCRYTEVVTVASVAANTVTLAGNLSRTYGAGSLVMRLETVAYSVAGGELLRSVNGGAAQAVASGVQNMQIAYAVDTDGNRAADVYQDDPGAVAPALWPNVMAVRVDLTVTENNVTQPFGSTIAIRNRAP